MYWYSVIFYLQHPPWSRTVWSNVETMVRCANEAKYRQTLICPTNVFRELLQISLRASPSCCGLCLGLAAMSETCAGTVHRSAAMCRTVSTVWTGPAMSETLCRGGTVDCSNVQESYNCLNAGVITTVSTGPALSETICRNGTSICSSS